MVSDTGTYQLSIGLGDLCPILVDYVIGPLSPEDVLVVQDDICPGGNNSLEIFSPEEGDYLWFNGVTDESTTVTDTD